MRLDRSILASFLCWLRYPYLARADELNIICLQGVAPADDGSSLELTDDEPDRYNDALILLSRDLVQPMRCTIEPGLYYARTSPHPRGAAHLTYGQHAYVLGEHKGRPALRGADELNRIWRDADGDYDPDMGEPVEEGRFGVNIHAGGRGEKVGKWSAGCIAVHGGYDGDAYQALMSAARAHCRWRRQIPVTVWRGIDLFTFASSGWSARPTMSLGTRGPWVAELQQRLGLTVDGDWGPTTDAKVRAFRTAVGLLPDSIVTERVWRALHA